MIPHYSLRGKLLFVTFGITIEQVVESRRYEGALDIGRNTFSYSIVFNPAIPEIVSEKSSYFNDIGTMRKHVEISIRKNNQKIPLEDDTEYQVFAMVLISPVLQFFTLQEVMETNRAIQGALERGEKPIPPPHGNGMIPAGLPLEACDVLQQKFGCRFFE